MLGLHLLYHLLAGGADLGATGEGHVLQTLILAAHSTEATAAAAGPHLLTTRALVQVGPELDQEEDTGGPMIIQLPQTALFLVEFVVDLPNIHTLEWGCSRAAAVLTDVYKSCLW